MAKKKTPVPEQLQPAPVLITEITPEMAQETLDWPAEKKLAAERYLRAQLAQRLDDPEGFAHFYWLVHGNELPAHGRRWIEHIYSAKRRDHGALIFAWRGSWKTTTISITFTAFRIGKEPQRANLVIQANDRKAETATASITQIIEHNPAWKMVFPNVVPDKEKAWGAAGYEVKRSDMDYSAWRAMNSTRNDPTLVGLGIGSGTLIGSHPDGVLLLDDIHDEENTVSPRQRQAVINKLTGTVMPFIVEDARQAPGQRMVTWFVAVGTPWTDDDAYNYLKSTGEYDFLKIPVMERAAEDEPGAVQIGAGDMTAASHLDIYGWWKLTYPRRFDRDVVVTWRNRTGRREFARMYLLDLSAGKTGALKYHSYPHDQIDLRWPMYGGCDLATVLEKKVQDNPGRDYFSLAYGAKAPIGRLIVVDGILEQCTQAQAESHLKKPQSIFANWQHTMIEGDGAGETFWVAILMRNPGLRLLMEKTGGRSKVYRQEREMGPWLENMMVMISDADTPYLNALRAALDAFPDGNNDIRDGLYWLCRCVPDVLVMPKTEDEMPQPYRKQKQANPFLALGG